MSIDAMMVSTTNGLKKNMPVLEDITTAIDALCIGFVYLELSIRNTLIVFFHYRHYNIRSFFLSVLLAKRIAKYLEKRAGLIAAIVFLAVGLKILLEGIL